MLNNSTNGKFVSKFSNTTLNLSTPCLKSILTITNYCKQYFLNGIHGKCVQYRYYFIKKFLKSVFLVSSILYEKSVPLCTKTFFYGKLLLQYLKYIFKVVIHKVFKKILRPPPYT